MNGILASWPLVRMLQLVLGLLLTGNYIFDRHDSVSLIFGLLLLFQAALNINCAGAACATSSPEQTEVASLRNLEEVTYEEIR